MITRLALALWTLLLPTASAAVFISPGDCAVIVASRQSLDEAFAFVRETGTDADAIYAGRNGWYAISVGTIANQGSTDFIARLVGRGAIPSDSYCSTGEAYTRLAWVRPTQDGVSPERSALLDQPFDARPLTLQEKRFLQAGLTLEGTYSGLIDGAWGQGSQSAYEAFLGRDGWPDSNRSAAILTIVTAEAITEGGWTSLYMPAVNASVSYPAASMSAIQDADDRTHEIDSHDGAVIVRFYVGDLDDVVDFHVTLRQDSDNWGPLYDSQSDTQIVSGTKTGNLYSYARSLRDPADGLWTTILIINQLEDTTHRPALIAATFAIGRTPGLDAPSNGHLMRLLEEAVAEYDADRAAEVGAATQPVPPAQLPAPAAPAARERFTATGSGFYINADAAIMTNAHVIEGCDSLTVDGEPLRVIAASEPFDLAILTPASARTTANYLSFAQTPARLNSDITVAGFPLQGILSGLNITRGSISSMEGLEDATRMQISAPIQPGNSGGPIVDRFGRVVGIVVAVLSEDYTRERAGVTPQNINFGIRGAMGAMFAGLNDIAITTTDAAEEIAPEDLADRLRAATVLIRCEGSQ